ncbi:hypothetical protein JW877_05120 [bacterium]|nr:hypothetical protein [bacterium]
MKTVKLISLITLTVIAFLIMGCSEEGNEPDNYGLLAYLASFDGLRIIDVTRPSAPIEVGIAPMTPAAQQVVVVGDYAYVSNFYNNAFEIIDISDDTAPETIGSCDMPDQPICIYVLNYYAYVATSEAGLCIIDISIPQNPNIVGNYGPAHHAFGVKVSGNYAYMTDAGGEGLVVLDISNPHNPVKVGSCIAGEYVHPIFLDGNYVYLGDLSDRAVRVVDISDPESPEQVGYIALPGGVFGIYGDGEYLYAIDWDETYTNGGLHILTYGDGGNPSEIGSYTPVSFGGQDIVVRNNYAYVASSNGLRILDISNPDNIQEIGFLDTEYSYGVFIGIR